MTDNEKLAVAVLIGGIIGVALSRVFITEKKESRRKADRMVARIRNTKLLKRGR